MIFVPRSRRRSWLPLAIGLSTAVVPVARSQQAPAPSAQKCPFITAAQARGLSRQMQFLQTALAGRSRPSGAAGTPPTVILHINRDWPALGAATAPVV
ncbi:MAG: hypothetical protein ACREFQ_10455, partial [Stellaceae bacterium]